MSEWKEYCLGEICSFVKDKISMRDVSTDVYISTENMLPDKGGITRASSIPMDGMVTRYYPETVLISNIRPYFKKIWFADKEGGCSNDVLCFKGNDVLINSKYLYYLLAQDIFFDYVMLGSKGSKMPRGDKDHIMKWKVSIPPVDEQKQIAGVLSSLDDKIDLLNRENATLEALAETLFRHLFVENIQDDWVEMKLGDFFEVKTGKKDANYSVEKGTFPFFTCSKQTLLAPSYSFEGAAILLAGNGDFNVKRYVGKFEAYQRTYVLIPYNVKYFNFLYTFIKYYLDDITGGHRGSVINFITKNMISDFPVVIPKENIDEILERFDDIFEKIDINKSQIKTLVQNREGLLPLLMSGEVKINRQ